ncbi:putative acetyltransferase [Oceanobacter sp. RED65]|uniref:Putative acetyltransferase n=2 Tax=Bermanella marisrubri TaxID=207949 RepID=Q1MYT1_9GAMM|nr:putative acetyltransferase [Oceanobacter sp. RED65] [Bermanella marisrubri]
MLFMDFQTRLLEESDVSQILTLQNLCFPEVEPESDISFINKIKQSPSTCWGVFKDGTLKAYLIAIPWRTGRPLSLDQIDVLCVNPNCLYLHDLAVLPEMRGTGAAQTLLKYFFKALLKKKFSRAALVAIQGSKPYWERQGFSVQASSNAINEKLASYGSEAFYMEYHCK